MDSPDGPPGDPVYLRWENTSPPHRKFYEMELVLSLFYPKVLIRRWGRIGTRRARSIKLVLAEAEEVRREVEQVCRLRGRHGYELVKEVRGAAIGAEATLTTPSWKAIRSARARPPKPTSACRSSRTSWPESANRPSARRC